MRLPVLPRARALCGVAMLLSAIACSESKSSTPSDPDQQNEPTRLRATPVVTGLSSPVFLTSPAGDTRLFVLEKAGRIRIVKNGSLVTAPFLDLSSRINADGERGLLGLAFHPQYATNGFFFVYFTDTGGDIHVERFHVSSNADLADETSSAPIITIEHSSQSNHNGGMIAFGADGMLYFGTGDGGGGGDPNNNAQNRSVLLGKLLRVDVDHGLPYTIPSDNPFVGQSATRNEIWAYGLRNPWRWSFDRTSNLLYIADVGQGSYEEVDIVASTAAGLNYGWKNMEGMHCSSGSCTGYQAPVFEYDHGEGCSITGGYVYRGSAIQGLAGTYFYSDYCSGFLRSFRWSNGSITDKKDWNISGLGNVTSFGEDASGNIYILSQGGTVYRIDAGE